MNQFEKENNRPDFAKTYSELSDLLEKRNALDQKILDKYREAEKQIKQYEEAIKEQEV